MGTGAEVDELAVVSEVSGFEVEDDIFGSGLVGIGFDFLMSLSLSIDSLTELPMIV